MAYRRVYLGKDSSGRKTYVDARTYLMLREAERRLGFKLVIVQGSYVPAGKGAAASAATHKGSGVVDIRTWDLPAKGSTPAKVVKVLAEVGFSPFYRHKPLFDPHIHAVANESKEADPSAKRQTVAFKNKRDGLKGNGPYDGSKSLPYKVWEDLLPVRPHGAPPTLKRGLRGRADTKHPGWTKFLQDKLNEQDGPQIKVDGVYDKTTADRVKRYKRRHKIWPANGTAGSQVWKSLGVK